MPVAEFISRKFALQLTLDKFQKHLNKIIFQQPMDSSFCRYDCLLSGLVWSLSTTEQFEIHVFYKNIHFSNTKN